MSDVIIEGLGDKSVFVSESSFAAVLVRAQCLTTMVNSSRNNTTKIVSMSGSKNKQRSRPY